MTDRKSVSDKAEDLSVGISDTVHGLLREAKPLLNHAADRMSDRVSELTQEGIDAVRQGEHHLEKSGRHMMEHASHMIRHEPFKAMLVAAGVGAAAVLLVGLMTRPAAHHRTHAS